MIVTRTPYRISFFGGGTDYPDWFRQEGGMVISTSIDKYCYINCRHLPPFFDHKHRIVYSVIENVTHPSEIQHPSVREVLRYMDCDRGLEIHHDGDLPARSGLGSSSSFTVGLLHALNALGGSQISQDALARQAIHIEQNLIKESVGSQDQIAAAYGGFNQIAFHCSGEFSVTPIILPEARSKELQSHLMLFFTGFSRIASEIAQSQIQNISARHSELSQMMQMANEALSILQATGSLGDFGTLLHEGWCLKKSLSKRISNPALDHIYETARAAGAIGGKLLGAGGGGFMLFFVEPQLQARVLESLKDLIHVPFQFENSGSRVVLYQPNGF
ncbi:GHMP family kinase ATP-binding protein [Pseudomonas turukhanskensis]|uniref:Galactokinase n=1 Tax=Pseudomonas turukhanskensis TaxID=1806536 RepID=A0A9W6NEG5_9PSED|nr:kinase [Pseudomonas turukhanskensis]GLK87747.1 galactokinase [Pseudomonas turukhanskensis]